MNVAIVVAIRCYEGASQPIITNNKRHWPRDHRNMNRVSAAKVKGLMVGEPTASAT